MMISGTAVSKARKKAGKKVAETAAAVDKSASWLYALEKSCCEVNAPTVKALARFLKVEVADIQETFNCEETP